MECVPGLRGLARVLVVACALALVFAAVASADWGGGDPPTNYKPGKLPFACQKAPTGKTCINAGVYYLDKARAKLGLPAYALPADFPSLSAPEQMFVLTNLDRTQYGLPPVPGLTAALNNDAQESGVGIDADPSPSDPSIEDYSANWAGAFDNAPLAYEAWLYDDGLGSDNLDCTPSDQSGCWGHRHDVLWKFPSEPLGMGASRGLDQNRQVGYAMLIGGGPSYSPTYSYTWSQAVADGAGTHVYKPGVPNTAVCDVPVVIGKTLPAAKRIIARAHCGLGKVTRAYTPYVKGIVILQSLQPGKVLAPGTKIKLILSKGPRR